MRYLVLWKQLASYSAACFRALTATGAAVRVIHRAATPDAPYDDGDLTSGLDARAWVHAIDDASVAAEIEQFVPDVLLVCSWDVGAYRRCAIRWRGRALRVLCMDNPWLGTPKQWAGRIVAPVAIRRAYDAAFLPGERQAAFARRLGFSDAELLWGLNACDERFFEVRRDGPARSFAYVGRLAPEKGIDTLAAAYQAYRAAVARPWPLLVAGTGTEEPALSGLDGVDIRGFVPPAVLADLYAEVGCLVLPSRFEPWGVVVQEAAAGGAAVVCTTAVGAAERLVVDGYNGRVVPVDEPGALAQALAWVSARTPSQLEALSAASTRLACQFTPQRWAEHLTDRVPELLAGRRR